MSDLVNKLRKYIILLPLVILAMFCMYFYYAFDEFEKAAVKEKSWEKVQDLELLCGVVNMLAEMNDDLDIDLYEDVLIYAAQFIEANYYSTYAQVFSDKLEPLIEVSPGVGGGKKHDPLDYPEFIASAMCNESGSMVYWYETEEAGGRYIHMNYKWIPSRTGDFNHYLVAVGVSKHTIKEGVNKRLLWGTAALILVTEIFIVIFALGISFNGFIWRIREGVEKWRSRTFSSP